MLMAPIICQKSSRSVWKLLTTLSSVNNLLGWGDFIACFGQRVEEYRIGSPLYRTWSLLTHTTRTHGSLHQKYLLNPKQPSLTGWRWREALAREHFLGVNPMAVKAKQAVEIQT